MCKFRRLFPLRIDRSNEPPLCPKPLRQSKPRPVYPNLRQQNVFAVVCKVSKLTFSQPFAHSLHVFFRFSKNESQGLPTAKRTVSQRNCLCIFIIAKRVKTYDSRHKPADICEKLRPLLPFPSRTISVGPQPLCRSTPYNAFDNFNRIGLGVFRHFRANQINPWSFFQSGGSSGGIKTIYEQPQVSNVIATFPPPMTTTSFPASISSPRETARSKSTPP